MKASKAGLADLKRLHKADQARRQREAAKQAAKATLASAVPPLSEDDAMLFRRAVGGVQPLKRKASRAVPPGKVAGLSQELIAARRERALGQPEAVLALGAAPAASVVGDSVFLRAGHGPDVLRDLRKGRWPVQASLDLHGCTLEEARQRLEVFLAECVAYGARCVRVVHGVGYGSPEGVGVLGPQVRRWLANWQAVMAYAEGSPADGGQGAVRVLLSAR